GAATSLLGLWLIFVMPEHGFQPKRAGDRTSAQHMLATIRDGLGMVRRRPALLTILAVAAVDGVSSEGYDRLLTAHMLENFSFPTIGNFQPIVWLGGIRIAMMLLSTGAIELLRGRLDTNSHRATAR